MMSAECVEESIIESFLQTGAVQFLEKPFDFEKLENTVKRYAKIK